MNKEQPISPEKQDRGAFDLLDLNENQEQQLRDTIEKHNGLIRVFVHPITTPLEGGQIENQDRVTDTLIRTLLSKDSPPIIVLEEPKMIETWEHLFDREEIPNNIYLVETLYNYPYPIVKGEEPITERDEKGRLRDEDFEYVERGFKNFLEVLRKIGVKKMLVGGTSLEIINEHISRCVGNFIRFMRRFGQEIEVKLSLGTAPLNRSDLRDREPDLI